MGCGASSSRKNQEFDDSAVRDPKSASKNEPKEESSDSSDSEAESETASSVDKKKKNKKELPVDLEKEIWLDVGVPDLADKLEKRAFIALRDGGASLTLVFQVGSEVKYIKDITEKRLNKALKKKKLVIKEIQGDSGSGKSWKIVATFVVTPEFKSVKGILLFVKPSHSDDAQTEELSFTCAGGQFTKGEHSVVSKVAVQSAVPVDVDSYALPPTSSEGPTITELPPPVHAQEYASEGDGPLTVKLLDNVRAKQTEYRPATNNFDQVLTAGLSVQNTSDAPCNVSQVSVEWMNSAGEWLPATSSTFGRRTLDDFNCPQFELSSPLAQLDLEPTSTFDMFIKVAISVAGRPWHDGRTRYRAHRSFPQPLRLRVNLSQSGGKSNSVIIEQTNPSVPLITEKSFTEEWTHGEQPALWLQCDDTNTSERIFAAAYNDSGFLCLRIGPFEHSYSATNVQQMGYDAKQKGTPEFDLGIDKVVGEYKTAVRALADVEKGFVYGFKFDLKTSTSSATGSCHLPKWL